MNKQCVLTVNTIGGTDTSSWYDLYKALIAVNVVCLHHEPPLGGLATRIGEFCYSSDWGYEKCEGVEIRTRKDTEICGY